jgi:hypothetical protein
MLFQSGPLQPNELKMLWALAKWFGIASLLFFAGLWLRRGLTGKELTDNSFRLVSSDSGKSEERAPYVTGIIVWVLIGLHFWPLIPGGVALQVSMLIACLVVGMTGAHLCILIHELGHLAAAYFMKMDLRKLQVGTGSVLYSGALPGGLRLQICVRPHGGFMSATPRTNRWFRTRYSIFVAGGPLADFIFLYAAYQIIARVFGGLAVGFVDSPTGFVLSLFFCWHAVTTISGLIPRKVLIDGRAHWTDGYWLLRLLTGKHLPFAVYDWRTALQVLETHYGNSRPSQPASETVSKAPGFSEQRVRLKSPLLHRPSTSAPPA